MSHPVSPQEFAALHQGQAGALDRGRQGDRREGELSGKSEMQQIPVLIVGGGPVGLALAGELGWRGVACMLVEQGDGTIVTPKMNEVNVRTMEFCRRWGIADKVHNCPFPRDHARDAVFVTQPDRLRARPHSAPGGRQRQSPSRGARCGCRPARRCGSIRSCARSRSRRRACGCATARGSRRSRTPATGVTAEIVDLESGARERIVADYLVGCDGAMSAIRGALGIGLTGQGVLGHPLHLFFRAPDLLEALRQGRGHVLPRHRPRRAVGQHPRGRSGQRHVAADGARHRRQADARRASTRTR